MAATKRAAKGRTVTVDGITVTVAIDPRDDWEFATASLVLSDPDATPLEKSNAVMKQVKLLLGDDYKRVMDELRAARGGRLPIADVTSFANRVMAAEAGDAKN